MPSRFFVPELPSLEKGFPALPLAVELPPPVAHHALRVLRLTDGEPVVVFDGRGCEWHGVLCVDGKRGAVRLERWSSEERESPLRITLVQGLASGDKMDWVVQKAVELGVSAIQPLAAERSVLRLAGERADKRLAHWQEVVISACEQCGRNWLPSVAPVMTLSAWLATHGPGSACWQAGDACWLLDPDEGELLSRLPQPLGEVAVLIGPEGGWSPEELALARQAGCQSVRLGPRVLRTETAGLAVVAALNALYGDW